VRVLERLGARHALVVYGRDGLDEVSLGGVTLVGELKDGKLSEYTIEPEDFGLAMASSRNLRVENAAGSMAMVLDVLAGKPGVARDIVALNAGAALYAADVAVSIEAGIKLAIDAIESGAAGRKMRQFVATTRRLAGV
jgi:anthranilate phosphoribosyltransferase